MIWDYDFLLLSYTLKNWDINHSIFVSSFWLHHPSVRSFYQFFQKGIFTYVQGWEIWIDQFYNPYIQKYNPWWQKLKATPPSKAASSIFKYVSIHTENSKAPQSQTQWQWKENKGFCDEELIGDWSTHICWSHQPYPWYSCGKVGADRLQNVW